MPGNSCDTKYETKLIQSSANSVAILSHYVYLSSTGIMLLSQMQFVHSRIQSLTVANITSFRAMYLWRYNFLLQLLVTAKLKLFKGKLVSLSRFFLNPKKLFVVLLKLDKNMHEGRFPISDSEK